MADQTSADIEVAAPPEQVLAVIADFDAYPQWVDSMTSATVLSRYPDGRAASVRMVLDHALVKDEYTLAYDWSGNTVSWQLVDGSLLKTMDGSYVLRPSVAGTRVTYNLRVDVNMPMIGMFRRKAEKTIIDGALKGLKKRVEG